MSGKNLVVLRDRVPVRDAGFDPAAAPRADYELIRQLVSGEYVAASSLQPGLAKSLAGSSAAFGAAFAAMGLRGDTRAMFTTGEDIAFRLLPLLKLAGWKGKLFSVIHAAHSPKWQLAARLIGAGHVGAYYTVAKTQRDILVEKSGLPAGKVHFLYDSVDTDFFDPAKAETGAGGYAFACGLENRDYDTLAAAAAQVSRQVRVQASGYFPQEGAADAGVPANLEISRTRISYPDLRARYAAADFVVVPLHAVPYAAGVNGLLEGMAMGKAVIVTESPGLADYTGLDSLVRVPAGDPARLAEAMQALWQDPAACAEMGRANRDWAVRHASVEDYAATISGHMLAT
ncbi:MAG: glycosyltransferase family 4 protein [Acidobacteria bacterium]|jgi:glycosyltransferase involved in cell wall biosynthesis|nr:glycosyltransferase family 4 protein [Acidobacteriota bacterium]